MPLTKHVNVPTRNPITLDGQTYPLDHLDDYIFVANDSEGIARRIQATFSDHCYTEERLGTSNPALLTRRKGTYGDQGGVFRRERDDESMKLRGYLESADEVWHSRDRDKFGIFKRRMENGVRSKYWIFFKVWRTSATDTTADLVLEVVSAFRHSGYVETYGSIKFPQILSHRIKGLTCVRNMSPRRHKPS